MDESLVALPLLLGVDPGDVLMIDSKMQGWYSYTKGCCFEIKKTKILDPIKKYLSLEIWYAQNYGDMQRQMLVWTLPSKGLAVINLMRP